MFLAKLVHAHTCYSCFPKKYFLNCSQFFVVFKQMAVAVACSTFTLDGWVQLFWAAFDMPVTRVPLKVALGYKKNCFLGVSKK